MGRKNKVLPDGRQVVVVEKKGMGGCGLIMCIVAALFIFFVVLPLGGCTAILAALGFAVNEASQTIEEPERDPVPVEASEQEATKFEMGYFAATSDKVEKGRLTIGDETIDGIVKVTLKEGARSTPVVTIIHSGGIKKVKPSSVPLAFAQLWGYSDEDVAELTKLIGARQKAK